MEVPKRPKPFSVLDKVLDWINVFSLLSVAVLMFVQVILRYVLKMPLMGIEGRLCRARRAGGMVGIGLGNAGEAVGPGGQGAVSFVVSRSWFQARRRLLGRDGYFALGDGFKVGSEGAHVALGDGYTRHWNGCRIRRPGPSGCGPSWGICR